jgi:transmembrane sensor
MAMAPETSDMRLERALRMWTQRHSGTWTEHDERQLSAWLEATPGNRVAYEKVARLWEATGKVEIRRRNSVTARSTLTARPIVAACAVALVTALVIHSWMFLSRWWNGVPVHWITPRGESRAVVLEDGTHVLLDADSDLVTKLGAHARRVSLVRGEALFTVTHDVSRPFEIEIGPGRVADLGTRFDVERLPNAVRIAVLEGRVGIRTDHGEVVLGAGRSGGYDDDGTLLPVSEVDITSTLRSDGIRHFDNEPLAAVVTRLTRYHAVSFVFADPQLQALRLSGTFRVSDLNLFLRTVSMALPIEAHWIGPRRVEFVSREANTRQESRDRTDNGE